MSDLRNLFYKISSGAEHRFDDFMIRFRQRMGWDMNIQICPYITFGNHQELYVKGRVLHDYEILSSHDDAIWDNLLNMYKRFNSHEIKGARLQVSYHDQIKELVTDEDGYFGDSIAFPKSADIHSIWHFPKLQLLESAVNFTPPVEALAKVVVPPASAKFGVISDIDDTILKTNATSILKTAMYTFTGNAHSRLSFPGVSSFYRALNSGASGNEQNPFFYISSSPWNLYDLLTDFIEVNSMPAGPVFLKDYGFSHDKIISDSHDLHKLKKIKKVLDAFPEMNFILIGDSGQRDAEIYAKAAGQFPGRILAIYLRDVGHTEKSANTKSIYEKSDLKMRLSDDTLELARHAADYGFIAPEAIDMIIADIEQSKRESMQ